MKPEREITDEVDLCLPNGHLNPNAVGWSRQPLHRPNLRGWGRSKRWEYWGIVTPTHVVGLTVSSLDYAGVQSVYVLDRETGKEIVREAVVPLARGVVLPERAGTGSAHAEADGLTIDFDEVPGGTRLRARSAEIDIDLLASRPLGHECLAVVVPWSTRRFQYTVKDVGRPASGRISVGAVSHVVTADSSFAVLDHGRGHVFELEGGDRGDLAEGFQRVGVVIGGDDRTGRNAGRAGIGLRRQDQCVETQPRRGERQHAPKLTAAKYADGGPRREGKV